MDKLTRLQNPRSDGDSRESSRAPRKPLRILIVTDAWRPQVNGVVRTYEELKKELTRLGHDVFILEASALRSLPCPTYPEIRLGLFPRHHVALAFRAFQPDVIHIATEGPLGLAARHYCLRRGLKFTTSYHTKFPEYIQVRTKIPTKWTYPALRWFHRPSSSVLVAARSLREELHSHGFNNLRQWTRGVDANLFAPRAQDFLNLPRPIWLYVGRIAIEKNIEAFLKLDLDGSKLLIGGGPQLPHLKARYPKAHFAGPCHGEALARNYAASDVLVFPSLTDTFGLVLLEALASGLPVAAFPVTGPLDILGAERVGFLDWDLARAATCAFERADAGACRRFALTFSWKKSAEQFVLGLAPNSDEILIS